MTSRSHVLELVVKSSGFPASAPIVTNPETELPIVTLSKLFDMPSKVESLIAYPPVPATLIAIPEDTGPNVRVPLVAVRSFHDTPPSDRKEGLFEPAAKSIFEAEIAPDPAFRVSPEAARSLFAECKKHTILKFNNQR